MTKYTKIKDFKASRLLGVGSADIATLAGLTKNYGKTPYTLWQEKTKRKESFEGNERTRVGTDLEAYVLYRFIEQKFDSETAHNFYLSKLKNKSYGIYKSNTEAHHPDYRFCLAHADLFIDSYKEAGQYLSNNIYAAIDTEAYIVEAKTVGAYASKRREGAIFTGYDLSDFSAQGIPDTVYLQVQWQLFCYDVHTAYVAALIDNQFYTYGPIVSDYRTQEKCLALAERFWRCVEKDIAPPPETWDDVLSMYPSSTDTTKLVTGDNEEAIKIMLAEDKKLAEKAKEIKSKRDDIENALGILIGENSVLASGDGEIYARRVATTSRNSISLVDLQIKEAALYETLEQKGFIKKSKESFSLKY